MGKLRWSAVLLIAGAGLGPAPLGLAKPPDLPDNNDVQCVEALEPGEDGQPGFRVELLGGRLQIELGVSGGAPPKTEAPPAVDAWSTNLMPMLLQQVYRNVMDAVGLPALGERLLAVPPPSGKADPDGENSASARQARDLFLAAQKLDRAGKVEPARDLLRKAHMINPTCHYGQRAIQRLLEMEATEECEPAPRMGPTGDDDSAAQAERSFRHALEIARQQRAQAWELRAAASLGRLLGQQGRRDEARETLADVFGRFTEGFETANLTEARALLAQLS